VLHNTPPELSADVMEKGIIVSGGSALLRNIDHLSLSQQVFQLILLKSHSYV